MALSGIDIAVWDITAQIAGMPLYRLLGGYRDAVPAYASAGFYFEGKGPKELAEEFRGYVDRGFRHGKMKVGRTPDTPLNPLTPWSGPSSPRVTLARGPRAGPRGARRRRGRLLARRRRQQRLDPRHRPAGRPRVRPARHRLVRGAGAHRRPGRQRRPGGGAGHPGQRVRDGVAGLRLPGPVESPGGRHRPARRDLDRRHHRVPQGGRARARRRARLRPARLLQRRKPRVEPALHRLDPEQRAAGVRPEPERPAHRAARPARSNPTSGARRAPAGTHPGSAPASTATRCRATPRAPPRTSEAKWTAIGRRTGRRRRSSSPTATTGRWRPRRRSWTPPGCRGGSSSAGRRRTSSSTRGDAAVLFNQYAPITAEVLDALPGVRLVVALRRRRRQRRRAGRVASAGSGWPTCPTTAPRRSPTTPSRWRSRCCGGSRRCRRPCGRGSGSTASPGRCAGCPSCASGSIGCGAIGSVAGRRAAAFGMDVVGVDVAEAGPHPGERHPRVSLDELLATSDVVSLHLGLTAQTEHLVDARAAAAGQTGGRARQHGPRRARRPVALLDALDDGRLAAAGLDVLEPSPPTTPAGGSPTTRASSSPRTPPGTRRSRSWPQDGGRPRGRPRARRRAPRSPSTPPRGARP